MDRDFIKGILLYYISPIVAFFLIEKYNISAELMLIFGFCVGVNLMEKRK